MVIATFYKYQYSAESYRSVKPQNTVHRMSLYYSVLTLNLNVKPVS